MIRRGERGWVDVVWAFMVARGYSRCSLLMAPLLGRQRMKTVRLCAILTRQTTIDYPRCSGLSIWEHAQEKQHEDET